MRSSKLRACYHEAGHVVAGIVLGIPVKGTTIRYGEPYVRRRRRYHPADTSKGLRLVVFCLAGPAAEERFCGTIEDGGDRGDLSDARRYLAQRLAAPQVDAAFARLQQLARRLVRKSAVRRRIRILAHDLLWRGRMSAREIAQLIR
jgi:hypothetical protein